MRAGPFTAAQIEAEALTLGIPDEDAIAMRMADRIIQRKRKSDYVVLEGRSSWTWIGS